jgi:adenylate cyclase
VTDKPPASLDAYDYVLRALPHVIANPPAAPAEAIRLLDVALSIDPDYAYAHALYASAMGQIFRDTVGAAREAGKKGRRGHARRALALGSDDSTVLTYAGWVLLIAGRTALDRATSLNPNQSLALAYRSIGLAITGEPKASETPTRRCA